ncbi:hypothetical protein RHMOL_Rhmol12G0141700 [Rhododendron molle]|uniref:Uncharacterized protein n=1 Tax=Rhododendron molle TaxID=49168 RepID=A0ACC0LI85_RHOML|nr:hypothetical protein RHMOL_Rhmol12G0141700 [Rhododendron molle]
MRSNHDAFTRRILTFPASRPCQSISPVTLLDSLITLSSDISKYKSKTFFSNNRNARQSILLVEVLSIFFEEIHENQSCLSDSSVLSLSELHFIFQKLRFLLDDCAREGARLWILMESAHVACHFRILIRAVATALDVLPLFSIHVSMETKESTQLVMKQALKLKFEVDPVDESASNDVLLILSQFKKRIVPDSSDLRRVLKHLAIRSWSECQKEIKFLESEADVEQLTSEKRDLSLLFSLIGFMTYCRGVLFDSIDKKNDNTYSSGDVIRYLNCEDFKCPISLEIMSDPVTIQTGHTYDRSSILKWFQSRNPTCPKTGEKLKNKDMVPNLALKQLISQYCCENGIPFNEKRAKKNTTMTVIAGSIAAEESMKMLANFLVSKLEHGSGEERNKAAFEIRVLTKSSIFNRSCLADSGAIPHLLNLLSSTSSLTQENSMAAVFNLSKHSMSKTIIVQYSGVESIVEVLKKGLKMEAKQHAAGALFYLASVEEYRILIGETPGAISGLMELLRDGSERGKKNALVAIFGLLMYSDHHWRVLSSGLVPLVANLLKSFEREDLVTDSLAVLGTIAEKQDGAIAILRSGILPLVVEILNSSISKAGKEYCVALLLALCVNGGGDEVLILAKNPSIMAALNSLLAEGTSRGSKKASSLIRLLHEFHERSSSSVLITNTDFPRDQFVRVW